MIITFVFAALLLSVVMTGAWVLQRMTGNSGWVDAVWSFGLGLAGLVLALVPNGPTTATDRRRRTDRGLVGAPRFAYRTAVGAGSGGCPLRRAA